MKNMTALMSLYVKDYHYRNNTEWIFEDFKAGNLLSVSERNEISHHLVNGIRFFNPNFVGSDFDKLNYIVNNHLAPSVLGRSIFTQKAFEIEYRLGCRQYVVFASGYDTFSLRSRHKNLEIYELDREDVLKDKRGRVNESINAKFIPCDLCDNIWAEDIIKNGFNENEKSFGSLNGISYYLSKGEFRNLIKNISSVFSDNSAICFDYPVLENNPKNIQRELAGSAGEAMKAEYTYTEIEKMLDQYGFLIYEHLNYKDMEKRFFKEYNQNSISKIYPPKNVNYALAVKK